MNLTKRILSDFRKHRATVLTRETARLIYEAALQSGSISGEEAVDLGWLKNDLQKQKDET